MFLHTLHPYPEDLGSFRPGQETILIFLSVCCLVLSFISNEIDFIYRLVRIDTEKFLTLILRRDPFAIAELEILFI